MYIIDYSVRIILIYQRTCKSGSFWMPLSNKNIIDSNTKRNLKLIMLLHQSV